MAHNSGYTKLFVDRTDPNNPVGISLGEIRRCLYGVSGGAGVDLSRSPNINKWAKFKPMPIGDVHGYTDAAAKLINYGLRVPYYTSLHQMFQDILAGTWTHATNYDSSKPFWSYDGIGANDWSRTLDFDGYLGTARELMEQITASDFCAIDDDPVFISHTESTTDGNLAPKDIHPISGGSILSENMFYGIFLYNGLVGRQFRIVGQASDLTTGDKRFSDSRFVFPRLGDEQNIRACIFLSSYNIGNGAVVENEDSFTGYFIPLTTSLATLFITFEGLSANLSGNPDTVLPWEYTQTGDVVFVFKSLPNKTHTWSGSFFGQSTNGVHTSVYGDGFDIELPSRKDGNDQLLPCWIRIQTDFANAEATVDVYATGSDVDFLDVFHETSVIGNPRQTVNIEISGELNTNFLQWAELVLESPDGSAATQSADVGTPPSNHG